MERVLSEIRKIRLEFISLIVEDIYVKKSDKQLYMVAWNLAKQKA